MNAQSYKAKFRSLALLAPWHDPTPEAWMVYADQLYDAGGDGYETREQADLTRMRLEALRFAEGMKKRPQLVLVCNVPWESEGDYHVFGIKPGDAMWKGRGIKHRWMTRPYFGVMLFHDEQNADYLSNPNDFPGMLDIPPRLSHPPLARAFYLKASYDIRVMQRDNGEIWKKPRAPRIGWIRHGERML